MAANTNIHSNTLQPALPAFKFKISLQGMHACTSCLLMLHTHIFTYMVPESTAKGSEKHILCIRVIAGHLPPPLPSAHSCQLLVEPLCCCTHSVSAHGMLPCWAHMQLMHLLPNAGATNSEQDHLCSQAKGVLPLAAATTCVFQTKCGVPSQKGSHHHHHQQPHCGIVCHELYFHHMQHHRCTAGPPQLSLP